MFSFPSINQSPFLVQEKYNDLEGKYKDAMVSSAKLYDEKTTLVYQVEAFKDQLEDSAQELLEMRADAARLQSVSCVKKIW